MRDDIDVGIDEDAMACRTIRARASISTALLLGALWGCGDGIDDSTAGPPMVPCSAETATATTHMAIASMQFAPFCVTIPPGGELTFTNLDSVDHTVTADAGQPEPFESGLLRPGGQFTHRFGTTPRTVRVHCRLNPEVSGIVIVLLAQRSVRITAPFAALVTR